jgi:hypothetical protein
MGLVSAESEGVGVRERERRFALMVLGRNFLGRRDSVHEFYFLSLFVFIKNKNKKQKNKT